MNLPLAVLRAAYTRDRAAALLGDLEEDLARRAAAGRPARWPALWLTWHACGYAAAAAWTAGPRMARAARAAAAETLRGFRSSPASSVSAVAILSLAIAAATVTFSVVDHVVLRPLPVASPDRLIVVDGLSRGTPEPRVSQADYHAWRAGVPAFETVAMWHPLTFLTLRDDGGGARLATVPVGESLFTTLGAAPLFGRLFRPDEHVRGQDDVAIASFGFWQRQFGGRRDMAGATLRTPAGSIAIVGVMPRDFAFPWDVAQPIDLWRPYVEAPGEATLSGRNRTTDSSVIARLRDGTSIEQAREQVAAASARQAAAFPRAYEGWTPRVTPLRESLLGRYEGWMLLVLAAVSVVLAVACVNVANLLLARALVRARDLGVRAALGAGRARLVSAALLEGLAIGGVSAAAGVLAARWGLEIATASLPAGIARAESISLDGRVLAVGVAAALLTGLAAGLAPAWQASRVDLVEALKTESGGSRAGRGRWRRALFVTEMACVVLLVAVAGLFVSSFVRVTSVDLGFDRRGLIGVRPQPAIAGLPAAERALREAALVDRAAEAMRGVPGVASVAITAGTDLPFGFVWRAQVEAADRPPGGPSAEADLRGVSAGYFETAGIRIVSGRAFDDRDAVGTPAVAIVDDLTARRIWGDRDPVGAVVTLLGSARYTVVGVAANVRLLGPEGRETGQIYYALGQSPRQGQRQLLVRPEDGPARVLPVIDRAIAGVMPPGSRPPRVVVLDDRFRALTADRRFSAGLMVVFGVLTLFIGAAGVYSVMAFLVSQQTRDIGVRMSLGATRASIARLVLGHAARQLALGAAVGLAGAWAVSGWFAPMLFGGPESDPSVYGIVAGILAVVGLAAAWLPARRAARVDPLAALRR
jgi:predicted permease